MESEFNSVTKLLENELISHEEFLHFVEKAIIQKMFNIARKCLDLFFRLNPSISYILCQAYIYDAKLAVSFSLFDVVAITKLSQNFLLAFEILLNDWSYRILHYSISIEFLEVAHPYLKHDTRNLFIDPLKCFCKTLHDNAHSDFEWRITLLKQYFLCLLQLNEKEEIIKVGNCMLDLSRNISDDFLEDTKIFLACYQTDNKEYKLSNEVLIVGKLQRLIWTISSSIPPTLSDLTNLLKLIIKEDLRDKCNLDISSLTTLQVFEIRELDNTLKSSLLLHIGFALLRMNNITFTDKCIYQLQKIGSFGFKLGYQYSFLSVAMQAKRISNKLFTRNGLKNYTRYIIGLCQQLDIAFESGDVETIEIGCSLIWDLVLSLLQPKYRKYVKAALYQIVNMLKKINSQQFTLLSIVYRELALCEEQDDDISSALTNLELSILYNSDEKWIIQQKHDIERLSRKKNFLIKPIILIDRAILLLNKFYATDNDGKNSECLCEIGECLLNLPISTFMDSQFLDRPRIENTGDISIYALELLDKTVSIYQEALLETHKVHLSNDNMKLRCQLWLEMAKVSRKLKYWNIGRAAARFCLFYNKSPDHLSANEIFNLKHPKKVSEDDFQNEDIDDKKDDIGIGSSEDISLLKIFVEAEYILAECLVELILTNKLHLFQMPSLSNYCINDVHKDDPRWLKFIDWVNILSQTALQGFINISNTANKIGQIWLVRNSLVCFWNYSKHLIHSEQIIVLLKPFLKINLLLDNIPLIIDKLLYFKLLHSCLSALYATYKSRSSLKSSSSFRISSSKNEKLNKSTIVSNRIVSSECILTSEYIEILKKALVICDRILVFFPDSDLDYEHFHRFVLVWVKVKQSLNQLVDLDKDFENIEMTTDMKTLIVIQSLSNNISSPALSIDLAINLLTNSIYMNTYLIIKLWCELAILCFKAGDDERAELCLTYGREKCYLLLDEKDCHIIKLYSLLAEIETLYAVNFAKFNRLLPNQIMESIIFALKCADRANSIKLVLTNLHCLWNYSKMCHNSFNFKKAIIDNSSALILLLTAYSKIDQQYYNIGIGLDIRILIFSVILKSFSSLTMWNQGIIFVEKALNLIKRENSKELLQFKVLFKAKMNRNVSMDITLIQDDLDELVRFDLWMLAAQAYTEKKLVFGAYKGAIESIKENSNIYYKLNCKLECICWLVSIGYQEQSLIILLEECMSSLLHIMVNRINMNISTANVNLIKIDSVCENSHHVLTFSNYIDNFALLTLIEIDHLFRMCFMIFILNGGCSHPLCLSYLQITLYCVYFMLKSPLNFHKSTLREPITKAKVGSTKIHSDLSDFSSSFPNNLFEWAQYFPIIDEDILSKDFFSSSLNKPNITLYYLHLLCKEISGTCLSHFQVLPLSLILFFSSSSVDLPEGWSILAQTQMLEYCKHFCFESAFEFWIQKISGKYISQLDKVHFLEAKELNEDLKSNSDFLLIELKKTENMELMDYLPFELQKSDYIIYLALETAEVLLKLEKIQEAIDIMTDCELLIQHCRKNTFLIQLQVLKLRIFSKLCFTIEHKLYIKSILSFQNFNVHFFFDFCLFISKILSYNLVLRLLDSCIKQLRLMKNKKYRFVYSQKQARFEIELATLKLNHLTLNNCFGSDYKRNLIDIEILLETIYSSYCIFYSDRNLLQAIKALNQYALSLKKFAINTMQDSPIYCSYASRMIIFQRKLIIQYHEIFSTLLSVSFNFSIEITEHFPLFNEYLFSMLTLASLENLIFEWCSKFYIEQKNSNIMSSFKDNFLQKYLSVENFSDRIGLLLNNTFCDNTESISLLFSLKMMSKNPKIDFEIGSLMLTLYKHYHMDIFQTWNREYIDGAQSIIKQLDITLVEFNEHQINQAYAISFISIAKQFLQIFLLYSLTNSINLEECKKISLEIIDLDGVIDVKSSAQLLNLFQSCTVTLYYQSIFDSLIVNPCHSKLALSKIKEKNFSLQQYFPRMKISPNFFNILRELPSNFRYLILQHSPDKSNLYYAYTKQPPCVLKGSKSTQPEWQPFIGKCKVIEQSFHDILSILGGFTADHIQLVNRQLLYFQDIIPAIQAYFHSVLAEICPIISEESQHQDLNLFLLCDQSILSIPIELLFIDSPFNIFKASSRDFSVQFIYHRFKSLQSSATSKDSHKSKDNVAQISNENDRQSIDISNTSYFIDTLNKMNNTITTDKVENNYEFLKKSFASHFKVTNKWNGFFGKDSYSDMSEKWQILRSSNILFLTSDDFSDFYKLETMISVIIKEFNLAIIFDKVVTIDEVRSIKNDFIAQTNSYSHIQGILSILGANILITNAFPQSSGIAFDIVAQILDFLLKERYKVANAINALNRPNMMSNSNDAKSGPLISCPSSFSYNIYGLGNLCIL